jgi:anhydro-N-acetylmuramic acid kinase
MRSLFPIGKKNLTVIGLNSGTSADGLDLAAIAVLFSGGKVRIDFIEGRTASFGTALRKQIDDAIADRLSSLDDFIRLDRELGAFIGSEAAKFCAFLRKKKIYPDLIGSHGQTIRHLPKGVALKGKRESGTLQIGHPETIAALCGLLTIADFRQGDIAVGGEGAPITALAMHILFAHPKESRLLLNIGGIANYFFLPANCRPEEIMAGDIGPGNSLLDIMAQRYFNVPFDRGGKLASRGEISQRLLSMLTADDFFRKERNRSTGREKFGHKYVDLIELLARGLSLNKRDILATATELTAVSIVNGIINLLKRGRIHKIYFLGGGYKNKFLMERTQEYLPAVKFSSTAELGFHPDYLEATCYAVMAALAVNNIPIGLSAATGARKRAFGGRIILPPAED